MSIPLRSGCRSYAIAFDRKVPQSATIFAFTMRQEWLRGDVAKEP
jgi:hypothetical protein